MPIQTTIRVGACDIGTLGSHFAISGHQPGRAMEKFNGYGEFCRVNDDEFRGDGHCFVGTSPAELRQGTAEPSGVDVFGEPTTHCFENDLPDDKPGMNGKEAAEAEPFPFAQFDDEKETPSATAEALEEEADRALTERMLCDRKIAAQGKDDYESHHDSHQLVERQTRRRKRRLGEAERRRMDKKDRRPHIFATTLDPVLAKISNEISAETGLEFRLEEYQYELWWEEQQELGRKLQEDSYRWLRNTLDNAIRAREYQQKAAAAA